MTEINKPNTPSLPAWLSSFEVDGQSSGTVPSSMTALFEHLSKLNGEDISQRAQEIRRLLRNGGFIEAGESRRFQLDPLPFLLTQIEWQKLNDGILQRVRLLQFVLNDLQGPKELISSGFISPSYLMRHPQYLRESFNLSIKNRGLCLLGMDIGRDEQGNLFLLNDHCQFPRGLGLLLENRIVARRVMSEEFAECGVQRIAGFFQEFQQTVNEYTKHLRDPRVVLLSKGPEDPYYSELAYLATYLGYTLVRSADLTVRNGTVWLKSLDGLHKVDVIIRWIEDRYLDSLEQSDFSEHGIPGLLQAVRVGSVQLINPFGNSILQIPAVKNNYANIARQYFGEELILQEPETLSPAQLDPSQWAGCELRSYVDPLIKLDGEIDRADIASLLQSGSSDYYFWRKVPLSQAPFWQRKQLVAKKVMLRCYALVTEQGVHILPSALCTTLSSDHSMGKVTIKDTWIQSPTGLPSDLPRLPKAMRVAGDMALVEGLIPSRTAESLFWLGSALERAESVCRLVRLFIDRFTELSMYPDVRHLDSLLMMRDGLEKHAIIYPYTSIDTLHIEPSENSYKQLSHRVLYDQTMAGSLCTTLSSIIGSSTQVRELLSYDSLRIVENLDTELRKLEKTHPSSATHLLQSSLDRIMGLLMAFNGSIVDTMSNSNGSFMLEIGRRVERAIQLTSMLETLLQKELPEAEQQSVLEALLIVQVSSITHRRRYRMYQSVNTGLELILLDTEYPRSLAYQIEQLHSLCARLPIKTRAGFVEPIEKALLNIKITCHKLHQNELSEATDGKRVALIELCQDLKAQFTAFKEIVQTQYFSHTKSAQKRNWSAERGK